MEKWSELLSLVKCTILSEKRNDDMIAFLLSESSLFVSKERVILKTCGQTTLLKCIKPLLELAKNECGLTEVQDFFYSRMNYQEPKLQPAPHQTFQQEVNGAGYALGRLNGPDTWFLYTLDNILPEARNKFYKSSSSNADEVTRVTGISEFLPGALIDAALFDPCGYSANGLLDNSYFSIHVTPQEECSYASFETNVKVSCYKELISKVLKTFKPGRFLMTLFANEGAPCGFSYKTFQEGSIPGYKLDDLQLSQMK
ncbi:hypothetical protein pdam_00010135, partial [Pocillopora damicornis]